MPPSTKVLDNIVAVLRRSPATVEHQDRHHAVVLMKLFPDILLDRSTGDVIELNVCKNLEVACVRYLDRSDREDVRLHQPRCHNASAYGLRGYVDNTLPSRCYAITMILRVRRKFFEIACYVPQQFYMH